MTCRIRRTQINLALRLAVFMSFLAAGTVVMAAGKEDLIRDEAHAGIHKKLIVATDVPLYDKPDVATTETLKPFEIYFQLWPSDDAKASKTEIQNGWVRIGYANGKERGWIKSSKVLNTDTQKEEEPFYPWLTRFMLEPRTPENDNAPKFTVDFVSNGKPDKATFKGKSGGKSGGRRAMVAILDDTAQDDKFKVAFFLGKPPKQAGAGPVAQEELSAKDLKETSVDLVFVIDTTASMTPLIEATKDVVKQCVDAIKQVNPEVRQATRFGLVAYQDSTAGLKPFEIICKLSDATTFQQKLEPLRAATLGSEEVPEDVLAGLTAAIGPDMGWNAMAFKHVMLIGDASAHLTGAKNTTGKTIEAVLEAARNQSGSEAASNLASLTFNAVRAKQPNNNDPAEDQLCKEQFQQIAQNQGRAPGFFADLDPNNTAEKAKCVADMVAFYKTGLQALSGVKSGNMSAVVAAANTDTSAIAEQMYTFANQVAANDIRPVRQGTASDRDAGGNLVATKKVFVSKSDIKRLSSVLGFLYDSLKQSNDAGERGDVAIVMNTLQTAIALTAAGEKGTQFDKGVSLKAVISELPLKSDALEISIQELAAMPDDAFTEWLAKLENTKRTAAEIVDLPDDTWMQLDDGTDRSDDLLFRPLRVEELP